MITRTHSYKTSAGTVHASLEEAQRAELEAIIKPAVENNEDDTAILYGVLNTLFAESDRIRDDLLAKGIVLKDGPGGTTWEVQK